VERRPSRDVAAFEATRVACELAGWEYRLVGAPDPVMTANIRTKVAAETHRPPV